ncbi:unnamed protein product [Clonostachys rosea]|uniref:Major facilitator superfamily (MFS) profile domain-containing protein n=1 Tax=Bionectria ochroleuca TaxID=29856 RepID=A0ABY6U0L2_BIOOC|nr:unnamed protein product [Clonostachys rosea]
MVREDGIADGNVTGNALIETPISKYAKRSNAKIDGMLEDLGMSGVQYNMAVSVFFIPYILFEIPINSVLANLKKAVVLHGDHHARLGSCHDFDRGGEEFGGPRCDSDLPWPCRVKLRSGEDSFPLLCSPCLSGTCLPKRSSGSRCFTNSSALAGAFSGLLAYAIAKMDGMGSLEGWRWISIIEGLLSVVAGAACLSFFVDLPASSGRWLELDEIRYLGLRHAAYWKTTYQIREAEKTRKWEILNSVLLDPWHLCLLALVYWANTAPNYGLKFSMPQLIQSMGFSSSNAQLMTIPPYMIGAFLAFTSGFLSDRFKWRMPFLAGPLVLVVIAYAILFFKSADLANNIPLCYFAVCLACLGLYPIISGTINNLAGPTKKAQGTALMLGLGNIVSRQDRFPAGYGLSFGFASLGILSALLFEYSLWRSNKARDMVPESEVRQKYNDDELATMGDRSPLFRYEL